jgi:hypothetical protein
MRVRYPGTYGERHERFFGSPGRGPYARVRSEKPALSAVRAAINPSLAGSPARAYRSGHRCLSLLRRPDADLCCLAASLAAASLMCCLMNVLPLSSID